MFETIAEYEAERRRFTWEAASRALSGLPEGALNIAHEALAPHAATRRVAFRFLAAGGGVREQTYGELDRRASRFADVLARLGVRREQRLFLLCGRIPALYEATLGALKAGVVVSPLFSAFGPEPIATRVGIGEGRVLVTTASLYRRKVEKIRDRLPTLEHVLVVVDGDEALPAGTIDFAAAMAAASESFATVATRPDDPALLHFTSGTTGRPKGALHAHGAVLAHRSTAGYAFGFRPADVFWCTADPGWVTGMSYGIVAPLVHGVTSIVDEAEFDADRWYRVLEEQKVNVWYTAPTAIRMLMKAGTALARARRYPSLRLVASVGEPLNPEAVRWGTEALGLSIRDNWWQTETGGIMIANLPDLPVKPGSMGLPMPGIDVCLVERDASGHVARRIAEPDRQGEIAISVGWPSMFRAYLNEEERYRKCFDAGLYLTGDLARRDTDGYYWFVGRADDVIKSAGHLIGPFEVESALMEHPAVAEAAVIGKPDPLVGESVKAFVSLKAGHEPGEALVRDILGHARKRLGAAVAPKEIAILPSIPKTRSGKIMRRLLKARELGLPEGDTSTLEAG